MEVNKLPIFNINNKNNDNNIQVKRFGVSCPNLAPLKQDTVSFKGNVLKKSDFEGIDLAVIERFKPNIQQFKSKEDLQTFAENKINEIKEKDFDGRQEETKVQRKAMLKEWFDYVIKENDAYSNTQRLVILSAITKDLKPNNDTIPPVLNKGVLAQTVTELEERLKSNPKENFDFHKMYKNNLRTSMMEDTSTGETMTGWVIIPSKENDPENFEKNVEKLKTLSHNNWCTKSFNAEPYLSQGDFHVYLENGEPKLGVRFVGDEVQEIQGEKNDGKIPQKYFDMFNDYQIEHDLGLRNNAIIQIASAEDKKAEIDSLKKMIGPALELKTIDDAEKILKIMEYSCYQLDGGLIISTDYYVDTYKNISFEDLDIKENDLFKYITEITGDADFHNSNVTNLNNLQRIWGNAQFMNSKVTNLGELKYIVGDACFENSQITNLKNLKYIKGHARFCHSKVEDLANLKRIEGDAYFDDSNVTNLGNLEHIAGRATFTNCPLKSLGNVKYLGHANFSNSNIEDLGELNHIEAHAVFKNSKITNLGKLREIEGDAYFCNSQVENLGNLEKIGGSAFFNDSNVRDLGELKKIGGSAWFTNSKIINLKNLKTIKFEADFENSEVQNLGNLEYIGDDANFMNSNVTDLGQLKEIQGNVQFPRSQIKDLKNLESIGGHVNFNNSKVEKLGKLKIVNGDVLIYQTNLLSQDDFENIDVKGKIW